MYLGIDIGGSKTLVASFEVIGEIVKSQSFPTPNDPDSLINNIASTARDLLDGENLERVGVAVPGRIHDGLFTNTTTLGWIDVPLIENLRKELGTEVIAENDATLGGLAEARIGNGKNCTHLLYITISTGVGTGIIVNGSIPETMHNSEGGLMRLDSSNLKDTIQSRLSGQAFKERYGKPAYKVDDPAIWDEYARDLALAIYDMCALIEPDCVVLGGGMSNHYDKFSEKLNEHLNGIAEAQIPLPALRQARFPEFSVIHGCAILAIEGATK